MWWWVRKHTHKGYFSPGRETESSFPHIPYRVRLVRPDFKLRLELPNNLITLVFNSSNPNLAV